MGGEMPSAFSAVEVDLEAVVDIDTYPIHDIASPVRTELVGEARSQMQSTGCFRFSDFVRPDAVEHMVGEATTLHDQTFWSTEDHNPYFSPDDPNFDDDHPRRTFQKRQTGFINADLLFENSILRQLYDADVLLHFIWECLGVDRPIYRWADPLARNPYGVMEPGHYFPWHFDGNEFTVSILAQRADEGGIFEYVPNIRRPDAENYEHVAHVLGGGRDGVVSLDLQPGDMQLFAGRFSMHRVTEIVGRNSRYIGLPSYVHDPYRMNRPFHSETIYGRATDLHHTRVLESVDGLAD